MINGHYCHETGCPNSRKTYDPEREMWVEYRDCFYCGCPVEVGESCDCMDEILDDSDDEDYDDED